MLPNILVSISERVTFLCGFPLQLSFAVCRISRVLFILVISLSFGLVHFADP